MAITKHALDYTEIATPEGANKLAAHAVRKSLEYDVYDGQTAFIALVLTDWQGVPGAESFTEQDMPKPIIPDEALEVIGVRASEQKVGKIAFRARILGPNSPHTFIPNPCESLEFTQETLGDEYEETRQKLVSMHTRFYTSEDFSVSSGGGLPHPGDFVEVFLNKGDQGFDLQTGRYEGTIVSTRDVLQTLGNMEIPWALVGQGARYAYDNPVKAGTPTPLEFMNKIGMPYRGQAIITSNWQAPGQIRDRARILGEGAKASRHGGTDIALAQGTPIYAVADGVVTASDFTKGKNNGKFKEGGLGGRITIKHDEKSYELDSGKTVYSKYGHMSVLSVKSGKKVKAGDKIGLSGGELGKKGTGSSSGPHLHMEIWIGRSYQKAGDPYGVGPKLDPDNKTDIYSVDFFEWFEQAQRQTGQPGEIVANQQSSNSSDEKQSQGHDSDEGHDLADLGLGAQASGFGGMIK